MKRLLVAIGPATGFRNVVTWRRADMVLATPQPGTTAVPIFLAADGVSRYPYKSAYEQLDRLTGAARLPPA